MFGENYTKIGKLKSSSLHIPLEKCFYLCYYILVEFCESARER